MSSSVSSVQSVQSTCTKSISALAHSPLVHVSGSRVGMTPLRLALSKEDRDRPPTLSLSRRSGSRDASSLSQRTVDPPTLPDPPTTSTVVCLLCFLCLVVVVVAVSGDGDGDGDGRTIVFCDLGSGVGRLVTQIYLDQPERVKQAIGIELAEGRHKIAADALNGILQESDPCVAEESDGKCNDDISTANLPIQLIQGDATEVDLDSAITHVFISSLCFPEDVLLTIQEKLLQLPNVRVVAALNRLDTLHQLGGEEWRERTVPIQMTWGASSAKLYQKVT
mmetsp:Transcript_1633/g.3552  ORF Transcript_1633/g.3552 Transcript_1633/m.3552 type:complete len:279 (+) Transcript_1633:996-1832(+)